jgi:hypothetical protein
LSIQSAFLLGTNSIHLHACTRGARFVSAASGCDAAGAVVALCEGGVIPGQDKTSQKAKHARQLVAKLRLLHDEVPLSFFLQGSSGLEPVSNASQASVLQARI